MKKRGHYCKICGEHKANEKFSGKGHAHHICKACSKLSIVRRNELQRMNFITKISMNFFIPKEKLGLLKKFASDNRYPEAAQYARDILGMNDKSRNAGDFENECFDDDLCDEILLDD